MADDVIKSFLVKLGFDLDPASEKKFREGLSHAGKAVAGMAAAATLAVTTLYNVLGKFNENWSNLFYTGQRSGQAVADINSLAYAFKQLGNISKEQVAQTVYAMSQAMHNPGVKAMMNAYTHLGPKASERDELVALSKTFHDFDNKNQQYMTDQLAAQFAISPEMRDAMRNNSPEKLQQTLAQGDKILGSPEEQAKTAAEAAEVERKNAEIQAKLDAATRGLYKRLDDWWLALDHFVNHLVEEYPTLAAALGLGKDGIAGLLRTFGKDLAEVVASIIIAKKGFDVLKSKEAKPPAPTPTPQPAAPAAPAAAPAAAAPAAEAGVGILSRLLGPLAFIAAMVTPTNDAAGAAKSEQEALEQYKRNPASVMKGPSPKNPLEQKGDGKSGFWYYFHELFGFKSAKADELPPAPVDPLKSQEMAQAIQERIVTDYTNAISLNLGQGTDAIGDTISRALGLPGSGGIAGGGNFPGTDAGSGNIGTSPRARMIMQMFKNMGYDDVHAAAAAAQFWGESKGSTNAVGDNGQAYGGLQWHADRQERFREVMGKDIHGSNIEEQVKFADLEWHTSEKAAGDKFFAARDPNTATAVLVEAERPADRLGATLTRAHMTRDLLGASTASAVGGDDKSVTMNQTNNVTINGAGDPKATGSEVRSQLGRSTADLQRNMQGAVR